MKLWVDDLRPMPPGYDVWAKNYHEAVAFIDTGKVTHISFDNDLGEPLEGRHIIDYMYELAYFKTIPPIRMQVHSSNGGAIPAMLQGINQLYLYWEVDFPVRKVDYESMLNQGVDSLGVRMK